MSVISCNIIQSKDFFDVIVRFGENGETITRLLDDAAEFLKLACDDQYLYSLASKNKTTKSISERFDHECMILYIFDPDDLSTRAKISCDPHSYSLLKSVPARVSL